jgi:hypothetical protein
MRLPSASWLALLLPALGIAELVAAFALTHRAPSEREWASLEAAVSRAHKDGDLVVVAPRWAEPHARHALGDRYFPLPKLARASSETLDRAVEVSLFGERTPDLASFREVSVSRLGPFVVRELDNPSAPRVLFDFVDHLGPERASAAGTDPATECRWTERARLATGGLGGHPTFPRARFECPEGPFFNVSVTVIADERFLPRRCIWAHPPASGARVVRFEGVPLGDRIVIRAGMYWVIERDGEGAPVMLAVRVGGEEVGRTVHEDGEGWERTEIDLGGHARAAAATVEFEVSTADATHRHFCFAADTR